MPGRSLGVPESVRMSMFVVAGTGETFTDLVVFTPDTLTFSTPRA